MISPTHKFSQKRQRLPCNSIGPSWIQLGDGSSRHLKGIISSTADERVPAIWSFPLTERSGQISCRHPTMEHQTLPSGTSFNKDKTKEDKTYAIAAEARVSKNESCFPL